MRPGLSGAHFLVCNNIEVIEYYSIFEKDVGKKNIKQDISKILTIPFKSLKFQGKHLF